VRNTVVGCLLFAACVSAQWESPRVIAANGACGICENNGWSIAAVENRVHARTPQSWVKMPLTTVPGKSFTKGKEYEFKFTRSGSDSIQFCYDSTDTAESLDSEPGKPRMA